MRYISRKLISQLVYHIHSEKLRNILMWPIARRVLGEHYAEVIEIGDDIRMRVYSDMQDMVVKVLLFYSDRIPYAFEPITARIFMRLAKQASCVVAAGGHLGYYALIAAKHNPQAVVHTFEPVLRTYRRLKENIKLNDFTSIHAVHGALSHKEGELAVYVDDGQSSILRGKKELPQEKVKAFVLDNYFAQEKTSPDLMLLDIEGYESVALAGAKEILTSRPDLILEVNPQMMHKSGIEEGQFIRNLENLGYTIYRIPDDYAHALLPIPERIKITPYEAGRPAQSGVSWGNILATAKNPIQLEALDIHVAS